MIYETILKTNLLPLKLIIISSLKDILKTKITHTEYIACNVMLLIAEVSSSGP